MKKNALLIALSLVLCVGAVYSHYLTTLISAAQHGDLTCSASAWFACGAHLESDYGKFLGIPITAYASALFAFLFLHVLVLGSCRRGNSSALFALPLLLGYLSGVVALYYLMISVFVFGAVCLFCSVLYGLIALQIGLSLAGLSKPSARQWVFFLAMLRRLRGARYRWFQALATVALILLGALWTAGFALPGKKPVLHSVLAVSATQDSRAPINITEFIDFECPPCKRAVQEMEQLRQWYPGKLDVRFVHFPQCQDCNPEVAVNAHPYACVAAKIGIVLKGCGKFEAYCRKVFAETSALDEQRLYAMAAELGEREEKLRPLVESTETSEALRKDLDLGRRLGVRATPTLVIDGEVFEGAGVVAQLKAALESGTPIASAVGAVGKARLELASDGQAELEQRGAASAAAELAASTLSSGILDSSRSIDWSQAGVAGGIPNRATIFATLNPGATAAQISSAIQSCPSGQVVKLNAGTYLLSTGINFGGKSNVTLRGAGPDQTILLFSASYNCYVGGADLCLVSGTGTYPLNPDRTANWTAGYAKGTTSITLSNTTGLTAGSVLILDQLKDADIDNGGIWQCATANVCSSEGPSGISRPNRFQVQPVVVTGISGNTVTFTPGLYMPNWRASQSPGAWWSNTAPIQNVGIEDLTLDHSSSDALSGIFMTNARDCWVKNVRNINSDRSAVWFYGGTRSTVRDSYFFGTRHAESQSYGIETDISSDLLVENNIFQHIAVPTPTGQGVTGSVYGYNYSTDDYYVSGGNTQWMQASGYHHSVGINFTLFESNDGAGFTADQIHGTSHFMTGFRNRWHGWESGKTQQTDAVHIYSYNRYFNIIGNVLGKSGYHTRYEGFPASPTDPGPSAGQSVSIFMLGWSGNEEKYATFNNDLFVRGSLMRWGNYDTVNNAVRWLAGEVPSGIGPYANPLPANLVLPASFYLSSKPSWWGGMPWPAVGPDVTGGPGPGGHAYSIPAHVCYLNTPKDSRGILIFNANHCYGNSPNPPKSRNDFNGDGQADILLRHPSNGQVNLWLMR